MYKHQNVIALIPARGGSKGLPGKNVLPFLGKPLLAWTIESALRCRYVDAVYVSTDSPEIARVAEAGGARVPFLRPSHLASDTAKSIDAVLHAVDWLRDQQVKIDCLLCLQATSPLRTVADMEGAIEQLCQTPSAQAVVSVCPAEHPPQWIGRLPDSRCMKDFLADAALAEGNRQSLGPYYRLNGALDAAYPDYLRRRRSFMGPDTYAYMMANENSVDIDTWLDFRLAELLMKERLNERSVSL